MPASRNRRRNSLKKSNNDSGVAVIRLSDLIDHEDDAEATTTTTTQDSNNNNNNNFDSLTNNNSSDIQNAWGDLNFMISETKKNLEEGTLSTTTTSSLNYLGANDNEITINEIAPLVERIDPEIALKTSLIRDWRERRKILYQGNNDYERERESKLHACNSKCIENKYIQTISEKFNLYGCTKSGYVHECKCNYSCKYTTITSEDGLILCILSGLVIGSPLERSTYGKPEKGVDDENAASRRYKGSSGNIKRKRNESHASDEEDEEGYDIGSGGGGGDNDDDFGAFYNMNGTGDDMDYDEDNNAYNRSSLDYDSNESNNNNNNGNLFASTGNRYQDYSFGSSLKVKRKIQKIIDEYDSKNSSISNTIDNNNNNNNTALSKTSSNNNTLPTKNTEPPPKKTKIRKCFSSSYTPGLIQETRNIIYDLLYNKSQRRAINNAKEKALRKAAMAAVQKYAKDCNKKGKLPLLHTLDDIFDLYRNQKRLLPLISEDKHRTAVYTKIIIDLWTCMIATPWFEKHRSRFHFNQHVIATLYLMQKGYYIKDPKTNEEYCILPKDLYLCINLPPQVDLKKLGTTNYTHVSNRESSKRKGVHDDSHQNQSSIVNGNKGQGVESQNINAINNRQQQKHDLTQNSKTNNSNPSSKPAISSSKTPYCKNDITEGRKNIKGSVASIKHNIEILKTFCFLGNKKTDSEKN